MTHYESKINVNNEWRTLLIVKSDTLQEFAQVLTFAEDNPQAYLTRQECAVLLYRLGLLK